MIVDFHSHAAPAKWREGGPLPPSLIDVDGFLAEKEAAGIELTVLSNAMLNLPGSTTDKTSLPAVREWNEFAAELVASHPTRVAAFAGLNPFTGERMLEEARRAIEEDGFRGVVVSSSTEGQYLDSPDLEDFWALVEELDVPVLVHPASVPRTGRGLTHPGVFEYAARAADVALSVAGAIMAGVLDRHPRVRIVCGAGGGGLALLAGRLDIAEEFGGGPPRGGPPGGEAPAPPARLAQRPTSYLHRIYVDTCVFSRQAMRCNLDSFGAGRMLFGTDYPPVNVPPERSIRLIEELPLRDEAKEGILGRNAAGLLKLAVASS